MKQFFLVLLAGICLASLVEQEKRHKTKYKSLSSVTLDSYSVSYKSVFMPVKPPLPVSPKVTKDTKKKRRRHRKSSSSSSSFSTSSSSSSSSSCECQPQMYNPPAPCTNCGCPPDMRYGCDYLQIPLRTLPSGCGIPTGFFSGKKVLVIGATSGIGAATAQLFQFYGGLVVGTSRNPPTGGCPFTWPLMKLDVGVDEQMDKFICEYISKYGSPPDILIDNGARAVFGMSRDVSDVWEDYAMKNQATGHIRLIKGFVKRLPTRMSSFVSVSTLSAAAYYSLPGSTYYTAPKQVLRQFIQNWGLENSQAYPNVFLGYIAPPFTKTNFARNAHYAMVENPQTASVRRFYMNAVAGGIDPMWVAKAFLEITYMRVQGQTCDIGYLAVNPENSGAAIDFNSQMTNFWNNYLPIEYANAIGPYFNQTGLIFNYRTTFTQCPQGISHLIGV